ncbi:GtrA family protein [Nocardioides sp.]|uniref:GtrA family protein n=1 Tax=Nocardioides sp. TaxID=35761 RepID=UPI001A285484|nr:GtrA family protein [Nocardioides sp.]MBJ7359459.1 GtrA family protein [Nocardioides sp.]
MENPWQRFRQEAGRFLAVGLVATVVALILFNFLVHGFGAMDGAWLNDRPELAYVLANAVGMAISFRGTKVWAFRDRRTSHADGGVVAFVVINLATMLIPMTCLGISRGLGLDDPISDNVSANVVGLALANAARFFLFREFVFLRVDDPGLELDLAFVELHDHTHEIPVVTDEISEPPRDLPMSDPAPPRAP